LTSSSRAWLTAATIAGSYPVKSTFGGSGTGTSDVRPQIHQEPPSAARTRPASPSQSARRGDRRRGTGGVGWGAGLFFFLRVTVGALTDRRAYLPLCVIRCDDPHRPRRRLLPSRRARRR